MVGQHKMLVWTAAGLVMLGVAIGAFSLGQAFTDTATPAMEEALELSPFETTGSEEQPPTETARELPQNAAAQTVVVYVSGAVLQPDTYVLPADARVKDVVLAAGGLATDAAAERVNLAERIADAQHIHIPRIGELPGALPSDNAGEASTDAGMIDLNSASAAELEALPRIGQALAERIVEWRSANGPFQSIDDVQKVKGVSASVFEAIKDLISVG